MIGGAKDRSFVPGVIWPRKMTPSKSYSFIPVRNAVERPSIVPSIVTISVISACVAFWPMMYVNDDSTGGGAAVFVMFLTIPAGVVVFLVSLLLSIRSHKKSLVGYNEWKYEEE